MLQIWIVSTMKAKDDGEGVQITKAHNEAARWAAMVAYYLMGESVAQAVRLTGHTAVTIRSWVRNLTDDEKDILKKLALQQKSDVTSEMVGQIRKLMVGGIMGLQLRLLDRISTQINKMSPNQAVMALKYLNEIYVDERDTATGMKGAVSNARTSVADELLKMAGVDEAMQAKVRRDYSDKVRELFPQDAIDVEATDEEDNPE